MSETMSREFINSFLETCFDAGVPEKTASEMLQRESVRQVAWDSPAFAEGYEKVASQFPGHLRPVLFIEGDLEKSAGPRLAAIKSIVGGLRQTAGGVGGLAGQAVRDVGSVARRTGSTTRPSLLSRYPKSTLLGGMGLAGGGAYAASQALTQDERLGALGHDPSFGPGGYNKGEYDKHFDNVLHNSYGAGIASHNKAYFGDRKRIAELEKSIADNTGGAGALEELRSLQSKQTSLGSQRTSHFNQLDGAQAHNSTMLQRIAKRQRQLDSQRTSMWGAPKRAWLRMTGRDPNKYFDERTATLQNHRAQANMNVNLAERRKSMLSGGYTGRKESKPPTGPELSSRFFPAYD